MVVECREATMNLSQSAQCFPAGVEGVIGLPAGVGVAPAFSGVFGLAPVSVVGKKPEVSGVATLPSASRIGRLLRNLVYVQRGTVMPLKRICVIPVAGFSFMTRAIVPGMR